MKFKSSLPSAVFSQFWTILMSSTFSHTNGIFLPKKSRVLFHPTAKERKINMFQIIIRCKVNFETHVKCMCKRECTGIVALRAVRDTTRLGYMMTSNKMAPTPRKTKNVTSRLFATPRSAFFPQYFESCDLRQ